MTRINNLSQSLSKTQSANRLNAQNLTAFINKRINEVVQKLNRTFESDQQKYLLLGDQQSRLEQALMAEKESIKLLTTRQAKQIELTYARTLQDIDLYKKNLSDLRQQIQVQIEEVKTRFQKDLSRHENETAVLNNKNIEFMKQNITILVQTLARDRQDTDEKLNRVQQFLDRETADIQQKLQVEVAEAQKQQAIFTDTFKKVCQMLQARLVEERQLREVAEDKILTLLEQVCMQCAEQ